MWGGETGGKTISTRVGEKKEEGGGNHSTIFDSYNTGQARENVFQLGANSKAARKLGADNTRILAKFSFLLILLYVFAPELGADQSVCRYTFSHAWIRFVVSVFYEQKNSHV